MGPHVDAFERELAARVGVSHAAALSSGTAAIHMALLAAGVAPGDIVFCQDLTFAATVNPIIYQNAVSVFIDSNIKTWNMDPEALSAAFEKYPQAKAVIAVHLYGLSADMDPILRICREHGAVVIEDAAESLGSYYKGRHTGTMEITGCSALTATKLSPLPAAECSFPITKKRESEKCGFGPPSPRNLPGTISTNGC
jgi:dTDP-4-amino-4,6-dideoxygalactose transaminase